VICLPNSDARGVMIPTSVVPSVSGWGPSSLVASMVKGHPGLVMPDDLSPSLVPPCLLQKTWCGLSSLLVPCCYDGYGEQMSTCVHIPGRLYIHLSCFCFLICHCSSSFLSAFTLFFFSWHWRRCLGGCIYSGMRV
jgi:hypothetical protein